VNAINRVPLKESATEAIYEVRLTVAAHRIDDGRELLQTQLAEASYPFREIEAIERDDETVELVAMLVGTEVDPQELDQVIARLSGAPVTRRAGWSVRGGARVVRSPISMGSVSFPIPDRGVPAIIDGRFRPWRHFDPARPWRYAASHLGAPG
jgi:hypothetical protein